MSPVDDIIINKQMPQKKKGKGIIVLFFILLIILAGLCYAYYWYTNNMQETPKAAFFKYIGQTNIPEICDTELYYSMLEKLNTESYETSTKADFTTTKETEFTKNVDVSKFDFALNIKSNKAEKESFINANITYSSNDFFDLTLVSTKDAIAIGSSEILDQYIATSKDNLSESISKTTGAETEADANFASDGMKKIANNRIDLDEEYKIKKANEYMSLILEKIPEEAVVLVEDSPITIKSEVINTNAYTLSLDGQTYSVIAKELLNKIKNDEDLLSKIIIGEETEEVEEPVKETPKPITTIQPIGGDTEEHLTSQIISDRNLEVVKKPDLGNLLQSEDMSETPNLIKAFEDEDEKDTDNEKQESILLKILGSVLLNQKIDMSLEEIQDTIDEELAKTNASGNLKVTIYVKDVENEENKTIKIVADLPEDASLDIEYPSDTEAKITFLQDVAEEDEDGEEIIKNKGTSFEIKRTNANTQTKFDIVINTIEEKKVIAKLQLDITTKGTKTSKSYTNDIIIKYNDNEGDYKINIENKLDFKNVDVGQELNDENTIFVDRLTEEEATQLYTTVILKLIDLYSEKIINMNFIDNNSSSGIVEQPEGTKPSTIERTPSLPTENDSSTRTQGEGEEEVSKHITKIGARNLLIAKIEEMMSDAEEHEEEFSILNLQLLPNELDGFEVVAEVSEEEATVTVAEYKFHIDKDFMLTEE